MMCAGTLLTLKLLSACCTFSDLIALTVTMWLRVQLMGPSTFGMCSLGNWNGRLRSITGEGKPAIQSEAGIWVVNLAEP